MKRKVEEDSDDCSASASAKAPQEEMYSLLLASIEQFKESNPRPSDFLDIIHAIHSITQALKWSSFPKDLWPSVLLHLTSPKDFQTSLQVSKHWNTILSSTEPYWESYVSFHWQLDPSIKNPYTLPASQYAKLRIYLESHCEGCNDWFLLGYCGLKAKNVLLSLRVSATFTVVLSKKALGLICANWCYDDCLDGEGVLRNSSGFCRVVCNKYANAWFGCKDSPLCLTKNVVEREGEGWRECEEFGEIRKMLGFSDWKDLVHEVVFLCVEGGKEKSVWSDEEEGYYWDGFIDHYSPLMELNSQDKQAMNALLGEVRYIEKITGVPLLK